MNYENNPKSIKYYVKRFLISNKEKFQGKRIVDIPAGNGITSRIIKEIGAEPFAFDLFPEYFSEKDIICKKVNISTGIPVDDKFADAVICQEGMEHFSDQLHALREFNRILKDGGMLLITTPNYSNIRAKASYLLAESERFNSMMAPNELDSVWMSKKDKDIEIYYGHIFLIGIQKLRVLAKLSGFKIRKIHFTRAKPTSIILLPLFYPFIYLSNWIAYRRNLRKNSNFDIETKKEVYGEIFKLAISLKILIGGDLMVEFEKEMGFKNVERHLKNRHKEFGIT